MTSAPACCRQEALQVLASRDQQSLNIGIQEPSQSQPTQAVPRLGLGKERFDPHLPLAHGFLVRLGGMVATDPVKVDLIEAALDLAPLVACGAAHLQQAGVAGPSWGLVDARPLGVLVFAEGQDLTARTMIRIGAAVVGELAL